MTREFPSGERPRDRCCNARQQCSVDHCVRHWWLCKQAVDAALAAGKKATPRQATSSAQSGSSSSKRRAGPSMKSGPSPACWINLAAVAAGADAVSWLARTSPSPECRCAHANADVNGSSSSSQRSPAGCSSSPARNRHGDIFAALDTAAAWALTPDWISYAAPLVSR